MVTALLKPRSWGKLLLSRVRRLQLKRVHPPVLAWVIACWVVTLAIIVILLWPGALGLVTAVVVDAADGLVGFSAPTWYRLIAVIAGGVVAGSLVVAHRTPRRETAKRSLDQPLGEAMIAIAIVLPVLVLLADHAWLLAGVSIAFAVAAEVTLHRTTLRALPALLAAGAWVPLVVLQFSASEAAASSWTWIALPGLAAAVAAFGAYYGVARAAETRTRAIRVLFRERWNSVVVLVVAAVAATITVLRLTVLRELFPVPDPALWFPWNRDWTSWIFAVLVAGVLVVVSIRSTRKPLLRIGQRRVTVGLAFLGNLHLVVAGIIVLIGLVTAIFGAADVPGDASTLVAWLKVAGVTLLGLLMLLPALKGTAARWLGIVASLFLIPNTLCAAINIGLPADAPRYTFSPTPVQVAMLLVGTALVLAIVNLFGHPVRASLIARFAAVPLIAVHAGWLLPAVWTQLGLIVAVIAMFVGLLLLQPPAARDNDTHSTRIIVGANRQLIGLSVGLLAAPLLLDDPSIVVLGLIWLSVVVVAALCIETVAREPEPEEPEVEPEPHPAPEVSELRG